MSEEQKLHNSGQNESFQYLAAQKHNDEAMAAIIKQELKHMQHEFNDEFNRMSNSATIIENSEVVIDDITMQIECTPYLKDIEKRTNELSNDIIHQINNMCSLVKTQIVDSFDKNKLFVILNESLQCDPQTDHENPKNVYPIYEADINSAFGNMKISEPSLLRQQVYDAVLKVLKNEIFKRVEFEQTLSYQMFKNDSLEKENKFLAEQLNLFLNRLQVMIKQHESEKEAIREEVYQKKNIGRPYQADVVKLESVYEQFQNRIEDLTCSVSKQKAYCLQYQRQNKILQNEILNYKRMPTLIESLGLPSDNLVFLQNTLEQWKEAFNYLRNENSKNQNIKEQYELEISKLQEQINLNQEENQEQNTIIEQLNETISQNKLQIDNFNRDIKNQQDLNEIEVYELNEKVAEYQKKMEDLIDQDKLKKKADKKDAQQKLIDDLNVQLQEQQKQNTQLLEQVEQQQSEILQDKSQMNASNQSFNENQSSKQIIINAKQQQIEQLEGQIAQFENQLKETQQNYEIIISQMKSKINSYDIQFKTQHNQHQQQLQSLQQQYQNNSNNDELLNQQNQNIQQQQLKKEEQKQQLDEHQQKIQQSESLLQKQNYSKLVNNLFSQIQELKDMKGELYSTQQLMQLNDDQIDQQNKTIVVTITQLINNQKHKISQLQQQLQILSDNQVVNDKIQMPILPTVQQQQFNQTEVIDQQSKNEQQSQDQTQQQQQLLQKDVEYQQIIQQYIEENIVKQNQINNLQEKIQQQETQIIECKSQIQMQQNQLTLFNSPDKNFQQQQQLTQFTPSPQSQSQFNQQATQQIISNMIQQVNESNQINDEYIPKITQLDQQIQQIEDATIQASKYIEKFVEIGIQCNLLDYQNNAKTQNKQQYQRVAPNDDVKNSMAIEFLSNILPREKLLQNYLNKPHGIKIVKKNNFTTAHEVPVSGVFQRLFDDQQRIKKKREELAKQLAKRRQEQQEMIIRANRNIVTISRINMTFDEVLDKSRKYVQQFTNNDQENFNILRKTYNNTYNSDTNISPQVNNSKTLSQQSSQLSNQQQKNEDISLESLNNNNYQLKSLKQQKQQSQSAEALATSQRRFGINKFMIIGKHTGSQVSGSQTNQNMENIYYDLQNRKKQ